MYSYFNPNPFGRRVGDCAVRAVSAALGQEWEKTYIDLCIQGFLVGDLPNSNAVLDIYLKKNNFKRYTLPDCPDCYTVNDFCRQNPSGVFVLGTGTHVVAVIDGCYRDAWDSGNEIIMYFYRKDEQI